LRSPVLDSISIIHTDTARDQLIDSRFSIRKDYLEERNSEQRELLA
jgi:hypothetical protein